MNKIFVSVSICLALAIKVFGQDTISLMTYNLLAYYSSDADSATRNPYFRTTLQAFHPDILVTQEIKNQNGAAGFLTNVLKRVDEDYQIAPYFQGFDTNNSLYYKSSKFNCIDNLIIKTELRDINHFILVHKQSNDTLHVFSVHLKASSGSTNQAKRKAEVDSLRKVTDKFSQNASYIVCGDFNFYSSTEPAYVRLKEVNANATGHFIDPINMTGTWNNAQYAPYHTQSPRVRAFGGGVTGGLDDRFDMILFSPAINSTGAIRYVPNSTFAIGNDGLHYNDSINRLPNLAVSDEIANALHYSADHLPVMARFVFMNGWPASLSSLHQNNMLLFPQPASKLLFVDDMTLNNATYTISDISGRVLLNGTMSGASIDVQWLENGLYILTITNETVTRTRSFIVAH